MAFVMTYDERNRKNLNQLGDKTKVLAYKWYNYLIQEGIDILIYESVRSLEKQKENIKKGVSWTMMSYHLVGQAFDFVPVDGKVAIWNGYGSGKAKKAIAFAKKLGFEYGGDWAKERDYPHLEYKAIGYGKDTFKTVGKAPSGSGAVFSASSEIAKPDNTDSIYEVGENGAAVTHIQEMLVSLGYKLEVDGWYGKATEAAVKDFQKQNGLEQNGKVGLSTLPVLKEASEKVTDSKATFPCVGEVIQENGLYSQTDFRLSTRVKTLNAGEKYKIYGQTEDMYLVGNGYAYKKYFKLV